MPNVKIRIEKGVETAGDGREIQEGKASRTEKLAVASVFAHQMINIGRQTINYAVSNIGNYTGDYIKQNEINKSLDVLSDLTTVGLGFATGGWIGGIVATVGVITKTGFQIASEQQQIAKSNRQYDYLRDRTGNATTNESRGTQN